MSPRLAATVAVLAIGALALPADAKPKPKPVTQSWDVTAVPFPMEASSHCKEGVEGVSRATRDVTLPGRGTLVAELTGFHGDWVLEVYDAKGRMVGQGYSPLSPGSTGRAKVTVKKGLKGQKLSIAACNFTGGPNATAKYTFTYA
jgi:hypothetical protein